MKNFSWKNKRENLIIELTKNLEDYKKSILESLSSLVPDDVGDVQFYLKSDNLDNLNEDINEKAGNLAKYMKDFEKASTIEDIKEEWFEFRTTLIKNLGDLKISLNKKLSKMDFSYINETYIQQLGSFEEKLDSMESEQVEKHLETYQNFTKEVGLILSNLKKLRSQIILNYNAINEELKHPDLINWKDLETAIDTAKDQFQVIRSEFISSQGLIYKLLILKNMLTETDQVTTFYDKVITSDDILQLEQTLKLLYRVINRLEDENKAFNQAVINFVLGKLHLQRDEKDEAIKFFLKSLDDFRTTDHKQNISRSRKEALTIMKEAKNISQSEHFASLILKQTKENKDFYSEGLVYINLTLLYLNNENIVNAEKNLAKAEKCATDVGDGSLSSVVSHTREKVRENSKPTQLEPPVSKEEKPVIPPIKTISQEEKDANVKKVISAISNKDVPDKGPYVYRGLWEFKCSKCNHKWTLPDIRAPSSEEYALPDKMHEICPKCNGTNIEKNYKSKKNVTENLEAPLSKDVVTSTEKKVGELIKEQITKGELPDDEKLKDILSKVAEVSLIKQESSTHAAIDSGPQVQLTTSSSTDVVFSDGPAKYQGAWVCTCNNCRNYWEVMDLTSRRTGSIDNCPKCNSSSIEKEKILY